MVHRCGQKPSGEEVSVSLSYALRTTDRLTIVNGKKAHLCTTNTFISILFLREESSRQRYLDSYLQDNSGDMQYSVSNPVRTEFHFSALHHGDYVLCWGPSYGL